MPAAVFDNYSAADSCIVSGPGQPPSGLLLVTVTVTSDAIETMVHRWLQHFLAVGEKCILGKLETPDSLRVCV